MSGANRNTRMVVHRTIRATKMREIKFEIMLIRKSKVIRKEIFKLTELKPSFALIDGMFEIFRQYIGMKDKRGREIYEGDLVNGHFEKSKSDLFQVEYLDGAFQFLSVHDSSEGYFWIERDLGTIEVIGNIYENPELLTR